MKTIEERVEELDKHVNRITNRIVVYILASVVISLFIHEMGHVIAFWMLGVPTHIVFDIMSVGPVLKAKWVVTPELSDIWFSAFFGPFFAGMVLMLVGKVRPEAYPAAGFQLLYAPFELMTWLLYGGVGALNIYILAVLMLLIPAIPVFLKAMDKIEEYNNRWDVKSHRSFF